MTDYYELLDVSKTASDAEIKAAYRTQALKWHPDRNKTTEASEKFKEVTHAYEVLSDEKKRQLYDQYGSAAFEKGGFGNRAGGGTNQYQQGPFNVYTNFGGEGGFSSSDFGGFSDPFEIFEQFFGFQSPFGRTRQTRRRTVYEMRLSFDEAVHGVEKETVIGGKTKTIKIPAGVDNGMRIRFSDFDIQVSVSPHQFFKREGQDVYLEKDIPYSLAVLGGVINVPTVGGSVNLRVRSGSKSGATVRLQGQGIVYPNSNRHGDMYVVFRIAVPNRISGRAKKLLQELDKEIG